MMVEGYNTVALLALRNPCCITALPLLTRLVPRLQRRAGHVIVLGRDKSVVPALERVDSGCWAALLGARQGEYSIVKTALRRTTAGEGDDGMIVCIVCICSLCGVLVCTLV